MPQEFISALETFPLRPLNLQRNWTKELTTSSAFYGFRTNISEGPIPNV